MSSFSIYCKIEYLKFLPPHNRKLVMWCDVFAANVTQICIKYVEIAQTFLSKQTLEYTISLKGKAVQRAFSILAPIKFVYYIFIISWFFSRLIVPWILVTACLKWNQLLWEVGQVIAVIAEILISVHPQLMFHVPGSWSAQPGCQVTRDLKYQLPTPFWL